MRFFICLFCFVVSGCVTPDVIVQNDKSEPSVEDIYWENISEPLFGFDKITSVSAQRIISKSGCINRFHLRPHNAKIIPYEEKIDRYVLEFSFDIYAGVAIPEFLKRQIKVNENISRHLIGVQVPFNQYSHGNMGVMIFDGSFHMTRDGLEFLFQKAPKYILRTQDDSGLDSRNLSYTSVDDSKFYRSDHKFLLPKMVSNELVSDLKENKGLTMVIVYDPVTPHPKHEFYYDRNAVSQVENVNSFLSSCAVNYGVDQGTPSGVSGLGDVDLEHILFVPVELATSD